MSKFKIKLIVPPSFKQLEGDNVQYAEYLDYYSLPVYGMGVLISFLRQKDYYVDVQDFTAQSERSAQESDLYLYDYTEFFTQILTTGRADQKIETIVDKIFNPADYKGFGVVGFSLHHFGHFLFAILLARKIRDMSNIPIVFGGAFITIWGRLYPEVFDFINYMIVGDGRQPFLKLLNYFENGAKAKATIPNLIYREGEKLIATEFIRYSFHDIPIPDFTDLDLNSCRESLGGELVLPYEPTRGCVYRCSFCIKNPMENGYQTKSYDRIIKELREMKEKYDCERFQFCDHNIACSYQYLDGLVDVFITEGLEIKWRPFMDIRKVDKKLLKKMSQAGCEVIFYGIESGSDRMLEMIHKGQSSKQAAKVLRWTKEAGIKTLVAFMVGYPHEAESDVIRTIKFIKRNRGYIDFAVVRYFGILDSNFMSKNPLEYGIRNLRRSLSRYMLEYDEVGGLSWEQKIIQRKKTMRRIMQVLWGK